MFARSRYTEARSDGSGAIGTGLPREDLWGVSARDRGKRRRCRGAAASARRRAKRTARKWKVALKSYLRMVK